MTIFFAKDYDIMISKISYKERRSYLLFVIASVNKFVSSLATSSDFLVKWRWIKVVRT